MISQRKEDLIEKIGTSLRIRLPNDFTVKSSKEPGAPLITVADLAKKFYTKEELTRQAVQLFKETNAFIAMYPSEPSKPLTRKEKFWARIAEVRRRWENVKRALQGDYFDSEEMR